MEIEVERWRDGEMERWRKEDEIEHERLMRDGHFSCVWVEVGEDDGVAERVS